MVVDDELRKLLLEETGGVGMSDEMFDRFIGAMTEVRLKNKEVLIPYGKIDTNLYVQKDGVLRACYWDSENEKTYGFSNPGTVFMSYHSRFMHKPTVFQIESCGETSVLKMSKTELDNLINTSHEFSKWLLVIQEAQLCMNEFKFTTITGAARERYLYLVHRRPEILARVPLKIIASYLGVAPNYLSYLKKNIQDEK